MRCKDTVFIVVFGILIQFFFSLANEKSVFVASIIGSVFLIVTVIMSKERSAFLLFIFLVPNQRVITFIDSKTTLLNFIIFYLLFSILFTRRSIRLSVMQLFLWSLPIVYSLCLFFYTGSSANVAISIKYMILILVFWYYTSTASKKIDFKSVATMFTFGCVVTSLLGLALGDFEIGQRFDAGDKNNANILGGALSFSLACISLLLMSKQLKFIIAIPTALIIIISGLLTQSRSFLLCMMIIIVLTALHVIWSKNDRPALHKLILISLFIISMISFVKVPFFNDILNAALQRVTDPRGDDISGGRLMLWLVYFNFLVSSVDIFLFGVGPEFAMDRVGVDQVAHNGILETLIGWGLVGFIMIFISYVVFARNIYFLKRLWGLTSFGFLGALPAIVLITASMTGHSILSMGFMTQFYIAMLALCFYRGKVYQTV